MATIGTGGSGGSGWIRVQDVVARIPGQSVDSKVWQDTAETILQSCRTTDLRVRVTVAASYPKITVGSEAFELSLSADGGHYVGDVDATLAGAGNISVTARTPDDGAGALDRIAVTLASPPEILALSFTGGYPAGQTEVKAGDTYDFVGVADQSVDAIEVADLGAGTLELILVTPGTAFTAAITVADRGTSPQALAATVRARSASTGAFSAPVATNEGGGVVDGVDLITCSNVAFSASFGTPTYPVGQGALKDAESATVPFTSNYVQTGANTIAFDSPGTEVSITNPSTYEATKSVSRIGGTYNVGTPNLRATLTRAANGAVTVATTTIRIANVAPTITVTTPASRLRSGGMDGTAVQSYLITLTANQLLYEAPLLEPDAGGQRGTWTEVAWGGSGASWSRHLEVSEILPDEKGVFAWSGLQAVGLAGRVQGSVGVGGAYTLGGFVPRTVTWDAFQTVSRAVHTGIVTYSKVQAGTWSATAQASIRQPIGTAPPVVNGYAASALSTNPHTVNWLDTLAAGSNSGEAYLYLYEETV